MANTYSVAQAAAITGVPLKAVNQYLDRDLAGLGVMTIEAGARAISREGLAVLRLAHELAETLSSSARIGVLGKAMRSPRAVEIVLDIGIVTVTIEPARKSVADGLKAFQSAMSKVKSDPAILSGEPCLKGTRISAYTVADLLDAGGRDDLLEAYPDLKDEQIEAARFYALATPRRGRPKSVEALLAETKIKPRRTRSIVIE